MPLSGAADSAYSVLGAEQSLAGLPDQCRGRSMQSVTVGVHIVLSGGRFSLSAPHAKLLTDSLV